MITAASLVAPVVVVQFPDLWGRNVSPFGLKLEAWLRLADIPYTVEPSTDLGKAPKGKLPYIRDEGRLIGDTTLIIEHLKASRGIDPDAGLGGRERAEALMLQRLFEEHFYFALVYSRWIDEAGWATLSPAFFGRLPFPAGRVGRRSLPPPGARHAAPAGHRPPPPGRDLRHGARTTSQRWPTTSATGRS